MILYSVIVHQRKASDGILDDTSISISTLDRILCFDFFDEKYDNVILMLFFVPVLRFQDDDKATDESILFP